MLADAARIAAGEDPAQIAAENRAAAAADGTGGKDALLDQNIGKGSSASANRIDVGGIVRKPKRESSPTSQLVSENYQTEPLVKPVQSVEEALPNVADDLKFVDRTVFRTSGRVVELE